MKGIQQTSNVNYKYWSVAEVMPREELRKLQYLRFKEQIDHCWNKSPFYRKKWEAAGFSPDKFKSVEDAVLMPTLVKHEIRESQTDDPPYGMMMIPQEKPISRIALTSGTTGEPVIIPFTEEDYFGVFCEGAVRSLWAAGVNKNDVVHAAFGFLPFIGLAGVYDAAEHFIGSLVIPGGAWSSLTRLKMLKKTGVTVLMGTPTYLLHLASVAHQNSIDVKDLGIRLVMSTGEPGGASIASTGARLKEAYGCEVHDFSGTQETNYMSFTCEYGTSHLNEDLIYFEILDPDTLQPVKPGEPGKLVITDLVQKTHPMIRFETGDIMEGIDYDIKCKCGRTQAAHKGFRGRTGDIIKVKGVCVSVSGIENVIRGIDECSDQYEYYAERAANGLDNVRVRIEPKEEIPKENWDKVQKKVSDALHTSFMISMAVEIVPPGTLPVYELKSKRFFDLRS